MKKIITIIAGFLFIIIAVLYHTMYMGGTPFFPEDLPVNYALTVLPLDSRPPCTTFVQELGSLAGFKIVLPPKDIMDKYEQPAKLPAIKTWLQNNLSANDGVLISTDMLTYGGLLHTRLAPLTDEQKNNTLQYLDTLKQSNPGKDFYVYSIIPRLLVSDQLLPDRWYQWHIMQWTINMDKKMQGVPYDEKRYKDMQQEIPPELKQKYLDLYGQNALFNNQLIELAEKDNFTGLIIGQDDTMAYGFPNRNRLAAEEYFSKAAVPPTYGVTQGADELGVMDTAAILLSKHEYHPKIFLAFGSPQVKDLLLHFVPDTLEQIALNKIKLLNGQVVDKAADADFVLFIHCGDKVGVSYLNIAKRVQSLMQEKPVALVDLSENYDYRECLLLSLVANNTPLGQLLSYAGWNSASNSIGTALAQGSIVTLQSKLLPKDKLPSLYAQNLTFNCERFLDDWAYEQKTRYKLKDLQELNGVNVDHTAPHTELVEKFIARELSIYKSILLYGNLRRFPFYQDEKQAYYLKDFKYQVTLPWERIFEIALKIEPTFVKKSI